MEDNHTNAILFVTHIVNDEVLERYAKLEQEVKGFGKSFFLLHQEEDDDSFNPDIPEKVFPYIFNIDSFNRLNYNPIEDTIIPGSNHFATLQFYLDHPEFNYYWVIEYDVIYTGRWNEFFMHFESMDADFMASHLERFTDHPHWYWWKSLHLDKIRLHLDQLIRSFNPIYRISNGALSFLDHLLKNRKNAGHHEVMIPTALNYANFKIMDFGGIGKFVPLHFKDRFYSISRYVNDWTMRDKPPIGEEELSIQGKLLHPYKLKDK